MILISLRLFTNTNRVATSTAERKTFMNIRGNFLTEKGNLKQEARETILAGIAENPALLGTATPVSKKVYCIEATDSEGHVAYVNIDLSVSTIHPGERKVPTPKAKAPKEAEVFTIID